MWTSTLLITTMLVALASIQVSSGRRFQCNKKIDLGIVLDASASMGEERFSISKVFAKALLDRFMISSTRTRVALSYFSFYHHIVTTLKDDVFPSDLKKMIQLMKYEGSFTNLAKATFGLSNKVFAKKEGARQEKDSKMVSVFLTDAFDSMGSEELLFYVKQLQNQGVETFAAQIYGENSISGMEALVSLPKKKHLYTMYENPKKMQDEVDRLARAICQFKKKEKLHIRVELEEE